MRVYIGRYTMNNESLKDTLFILNKFIYRDDKSFDYHMAHIEYVYRYAQLVNSKLNNSVDDLLLQIISYAHDILKEKGLQYDHPISWYGKHIPNDLNKYVRMNIDVLDRFDLGDYFNTDIGYHALAAVIFLYKEFRIDDPKIIYPVAFHSCPIIPIYSSLDESIRQIVDIILISDKLSSNWLKINMMHYRTKVDLDLLVFGEDHLEFNYTTGLFVARMIGRGNSTEKFGRESMLYYYDRAKKVNPFITKNFAKGENKIWSERDVNPLLQLTDV